MQPRCGYALEAYAIGHQFSKFLRWPAPFSDTNPPGGGLLKGFRCHVPLSHVRPHTLCNTETLNLLWCSSFYKAWEICIAVSGLHARDVSFGGALQHYDVHHCPFKTDKCKNACPPGKSICPEDLVRMSRTVPRQTSEPWKKMTDR